MYKYFFFFTFLIKVSLSQEIAQEAFNQKMEIGGIVTLDLEAPPDKVKEVNMQIGTVELMANIRLAQNLLSGITLLSEGDLSQISIDRALAEYTLTNQIKGVFGQQLYPHGLLTSRLISDPQMIEDVETTGPGALLLYTQKIYTLGFGTTYLSSTPETENLTEGNSGIWKGILALDINGSEDMQTRLSMLVSEEQFETALGSGNTLGPLLVDVEVFKRWQGESDELSAGNLTLTLPLYEVIHPAIRLDLQSPKDFKEWEQALALGCIVNLPDNLFAGIEYSFTDFTDPNNHKIALQLGLESSLQLPGIQRTTLTNPN